MKKINRMNIALVAHDKRKTDLIEWVEYNAEALSHHHIICTGTTGKMVKDAMKGKGIDLDVERMKSGPLGGDQELGAKIANENIDLLIFLWDPMTTQPHDVDVKALLRLTVLYNVPTACNRSTADYMVSSSLWGADYHRKHRDYSDYTNRKI